MYTGASSQVWAPDEMYFPTLLSILQQLKGSGDEADDDDGTNSSSGGSRSAGAGVVLPAVKKAMVTYVDW